jgi:hypothetical protein
MRSGFAVLYPKTSQQEADQKDKAMLLHSFEVFWDGLNVQQTAIAAQFHFLT